MEALLPGKITEFKNIAQELSNWGKTWKVDNLKASGVRRLIKSLSRYIPEVSGLVELVDKRDPLEILSQIMEKTLFKISAVGALLASSFTKEDLVRQQISNFLSQEGLTFEEAEAFLMGLSGLKKTGIGGTLILNEESKKTFLEGYIATLKEILLCKENILEFYKDLVCLTETERTRLVNELSINRQVTAPIILMKQTAIDMAKSIGARQNADALRLQNVKIIKDAFTMIVAKLEEGKNQVAYQENIISAKLGELTLTLSGRIEGLCE